MATTKTKKKENTWTLKTAFIEAILASANGNQRQSFTNPATKETILAWVGTYLVNFTREQADKEFKRFLKAGFIFKIKHRKKLYYPSYDLESLKRLGIDDPKLAKYLKKHALFLDKEPGPEWRIRGAHYTGAGSGFDWMIGPDEDE